MRPRLFARTAIATILVGSVGIPPAGSASPAVVRLDAPGFTLPSSGAAAPYPSTVQMDWCPGEITDVNLVLRSLSHAYPDDIDLLLVGPGGQSATLMSDAGGGGDLVNMTIGFDDEAVFTLPDEDEFLPGDYKPANHVGPGSDSFPLPAPTPSGASALSVFDGSDPNGPWSLYAVDDFFGDAGAVSSWELSITVDPGGGATSVCVATDGPAQPYPSPQVISGLAGEIADIDLRLDGLSTPVPEALELQLVSPQGQSAVLMARAGGANRLSDRVLTLDDEAPAALPNEGALLLDSYRPTDHGGGSSLAPPAPPPSGATLSVFDGSDPNGLWQLFVEADAVHASLSHWELEITMSPPILAATKTSASEGRRLVYRISRSGPGMAHAIELPYVTKGKGAKRSSDFVRKQGVLTFAGGQTSAVIKVRTREDRVQERREKVILRLTLPWGGTLKIPATIRDDD